MHRQIIATDRGPLLVSVPNSTMDGDGFYVSFNDHDIGVYGCATTALVLGQGQKFYILKGDHRAMYAALISQGFDACLSYFKANLGDVHRYSDKLTTVDQAA
ncbi:MAG: hypothetical protein IPG27_20420 [Ottowia sp.]|nr:hypothetical protein [Ottowia sp.]